MPGVAVDGKDVLAVYEAAQQAIQRAREGGGPTLLECKTYRWRTHSESRGNPPDPRPQSEIDLSQSHDPISAFADRLVEQGIATLGDLDKPLGRLPRPSKPPSNLSKPVLCPALKMH